MNANRDWVVRSGAKQLNDRRGNSFVIEQINFGFVVRQNHRILRLSVHWVFVGALATRLFA